MTPARHRRHSRTVGGIVIGTVVLGALLLARGSLPFSEAAAKSVQSPKRGGPLPRVAPVLPGKALYERKCAPCHGTAGKGDGLLGRELDPLPRDFTSGTYKFRSTPTGGLPTDEDLHRTIRRGIPNSGMPPWPQLKDQEVALLIAYIKGFSERFKSEKPDPPLPIPDPPSSTPELIAQGQVAYEKMQCAKCHGESGKGDGEAAGELVDEWERPIKAADFTLGIYKGGGSDRDLYRAITVGLAGTPMPAYGDLLTPDERWALIAYVKSLAR